MKRLACLLLFLTFASTLLAQTTVSSPDGRKQVTAIQATGTMRIDGVLDEDVWSKAAPATGFTILPRVDRFEAQGPRLTPATAPQLLSIIEEVAKATAQPRPEEVYLLSDVNAFVSHRGGFMGFGAERWRRRCRSHSIPV